MEQKLKELVLHMGKDVDRKVEYEIQKCKAHIMKMIYANFALLYLFLAFLEIYK